MTEPHNPLESRLAGLRPRAITPDLEPRIATALANKVPTRAATALFWTNIAGGALAASTIITLLIGQAIGGARPRPSMLAATNPPQRAMPGPVLASADWRWGDELKLGDERRIP